ncbi:hypothetical protein ZIOFF_073406 [Zingiber officinale]|uniref:Uncharacterized protein n=2 Tax=Zingiber officinale TaxID=94328 RepID=A0A8J5BYJ1_ZINOF|nr:hypothetical protein ZIOFF_073406 [Zingiber officinale]
MSNVRKILDGQKVGPVEFACITSFVGLHGRRGNLPRRQDNLASKTDFVRADVRNCYVSTAGKNEVSSGFSEIQDSLWGILSSSSSAVVLVPGLTRIRYLGQVLAFELALFLFCFVLFMIHKNVANVGTLLLFLLTCSSALPPLSPRRRYRRNTYVILSVYQCFILIPYILVRNLKTNKNLHWNLALKILSMKLLGSVECIHHLMILLGLNVLLFAYEYKAQAPGASAASSLNTLLQDYAYRALVRPITGVTYNGTVPMNLTGMRIAAVRLRSGSLRRKGISYKEFQIPLGLIVQPYVERLVLVYHNLGNWSSFYYPLPGYTYLTPVLGLLAYDATNLSAINLPELSIVVSGLFISINFTSVTPVRSGAIARCVWFGVNGTSNLQELASSNTCSSIYGLGHFSIVVDSSEIAPSEAPSLLPGPGPGPVPSPSGSKNSNSKAWRIVGGVVGGLVALVVLTLLVFCIHRARKKKKMVQLEQHADAGVPLQTARIGNTPIPVASGTRTQPLLENELVA